MVSVVHKHVSDELVALNADISSATYFGDALNVAARIQAIAPPGGVSVSGSVYQALDEPELRFRSIGHQGLKNIPEQVEVFQFADLPSDEDVPSTSNGLSLKSPTVVVFPVHAELADPEVASAAEMIRSDLVHNLASIPNLNVVDADDIDRTTLDVAAGYFLDSGIHQIGDNVMVYAKVVDASTWNVFSSHKWTSTKDELFSLHGMDIQRPTCDVTFAVEGSVRRYLGQWEESVDLLDTAMRLTAVNKPWYPTVQVCSLYMGGRLEQAASTAEAVLAYQPHNLEALLSLAAAQAEQRMTDGPMQ